MFVKLAVIATVVAATNAVYNGPLAGGLPAAQYPAGVSPQACPNYPNCENPAVAVNQVPITHYSPIPQSQYQPQYQQLQYNPVPIQPHFSLDVQNALDRGEYIGDGDYHGEGLAEALAPGFQGHPQAYRSAPPYNQAVFAHQVPAGVGQPAQIPAGVDPNSCPNYPFCH